jgi:hypothetical protein
VLDTRRCRPRARREVDAADQLGKEFAEQVGQQRPDRLGAPGNEAARRSERHVAQARRRAFDARARHRREVGAAIQGA